ncbi:MAG: glycosyltransferase family 2 protein, partial [Erysipelotrichaceae bacterium]|nr:glycosyltransferase family 2 protein [Erysipelotrichaceae bacterium]
MSKVSVIVPVYNVENYIRDMLTSVQEQTFRDFEVVIINDGSPDNSQAIIDEFCAADPRFKSFVQENGGVAAARNSGIAKATGDYVVFYDPDDYIPPDALEKMYKTAASKDADLVIGIMEEKSLGESLIYMHSQALAKQDRIDPMDTHFTGAWSLCHKMFSRK